MAPAPVIRLHPDDGVVIARATPAARARRWPTASTTVERIPAGHKVAIRPIAVGEPIRRYGQIIGFATAPIAPGQHVHMQNCGMGDFAKDYAYGVDAKPTPNCRSARDLRGHPPPRRPRGDPQLHRHPDRRELQRACRRAGRRHVPPQSVHRRRSAGRFSQRRWRGGADPQDRLRHDRRTSRCALLRRTLGGYARHANFSARRSCWAWAARSTRSAA